MNYRAEVLKNCPNFLTDSLETKLSLGGLGTAGEGGEVADVIKKILHHREPGQTVEHKTAQLYNKLVKEMGDVYWYLEYLGATLGISTEDVKQVNVEKMRERHPNGWTPQTQAAKADELRL